MERNKTTDIARKLVSLLTPLSSDERQRVVKAALLLLGEPSVDLREETGDGKGTGSGEVAGVHTRARAWMKQNQVSSEQLQQVFHIENGVAEVISDVPGSSDKVKTLNAYVLAGIASLLATGEAKFSDKVARELCDKSGCLNRTNHSTYLQDKGRDFTGTKEKGWTLTAPGLTHGANLVKSLDK